MFGTILPNLMSILLRLYSMLGANLAFFSPNDLSRLLISYLKLISTILFDTHSENSLPDFKSNLKPTKESGAFYFIYPDGSDKEV